MARLLTAGAEEATRRGMMDIFNIPTATANESTGIADVFNRHQVTPRTGDYCYVGYQSNDNDYSGGFRWMPPSNMSEIYIGFGVYLTAFSNPPGVTYNYKGALRFGIDNLQMVFAGGGITVYRGTTSITGPHSLSAGLNQWTYVEVYAKSHASTGIVTVKIDGVQSFSTSSLNTGAGVLGDVVFGGANTAQYVYFDDIVINSVDGASNNSWPGQVRLFPLRVNRAGDVSNMTRKGVDLGYNHAQVREVGSGIAFLESGTVGNYDLVGVDAPDLPAGATINQIIVQTHARTGAGGRSIINKIKSGATENEAASRTLGYAWKAYQDVWLTNPGDSAAWGEADLPSLQIGAEVA